MSKLLQEQIDDHTLRLKTLRDTEKALRLLRDAIKGHDVFTSEEQNRIDAEIDVTEQRIQKEEAALHSKSHKLTVTLKKCESDLRIRAEILDRIFGRPEMSDHAELMSIFATHQKVLRQMCDDIATEDD